RSNRRYGFLSLCNFNDDVREVVLNLKIPGMNKSITIPQDGKILLPNRTAYILPLNVPLAKRIKIRYSTAEILKVNCTEKELKLVFHGGVDGACEMLIEIKKPRGVNIDGAETCFKHKDGLLKLSFALTGKKQNLVIDMG
ncbi:MAG: hypothetical protein U9R52_00575, partial [Candidatus Omnitrophota bacterium]|nr:hypothetical protein [Candidatus Omnitrophota bacterium]